MNWKRLLYLSHRWAGIVLCLFFALWFASGIFMMYVEFPQLTQSERSHGSQVLDFSSATLSPAQALAQLRMGDFSTEATPTRLRTLEIEEPERRVTPGSIRLSMIADRPAYVIHADNGAQPRVVFADDGSVMREVDVQAGMNAVAAFAKRSGYAQTDAITLEGSIQTDQWTVSSALNEHRPLLKYSLNDADGSQLYVSSTTREVVRDTHRRERVLNYFGAVTHWIYPTFIRKYPELWEWIVDIAAGVGVALAISGLWIGWLRWNRRARPGKRQVPYRGLMRWHYFTGIIFGLVTVTWVFSGLLSMNPLSLNPPRQAEEDQHLLYAGKELTAEDFELPSQGFGDAAFEAELIHYGGQPFYRVRDRDAGTRLVAGRPNATGRPDSTRMLGLAPDLMPGSAMVEATVLNAYDNYYYSRHPERGERPLPAIRVRFADRDRTWFHLDPLTGQILDRSTRTNRVYRWLYNGLHSFDIWWLWNHRPLWDICVITFSAGGLLLSVIGVVIGWRRMEFKFRRRQCAIEASAAASR